MYLKLPGDPVAFTYAVAERVVLGSKAGLSGIWTFCPLPPKLRADPK